MKSNTGFVAMGAFLIAVCGVVAYILLAEPSVPVPPATPEQNETSARGPETKPPSAPPSPSGEERPTERKPPRSGVKEGGDRTTTKDTIEVKDPESGGLSIRGKVVDARRNPIENATVELEGVASRKRTATTPSNGTFEFDNLRKGSYHLKAYKGFFAPAEVDNVPAGARNVTFVLEAQSTISGRVVGGPSGKPLKKFRVAVFPALPPEANGALMRTNLSWQQRQDAAGHFVLKDVPNNVALVVAAVAEEHTVGYADVDPIARGKSVDEVVVSLPAGGHAEGWVCDTDGKAIPGAAIYVGTGNSGAPETQTDGEGRFVVTTISFQDTVLTASHAGYAPASAEIGSRTGITIVLEAGGVIEGTVQRDGEPLAGVQVKAQATQQAQQTHLTGETDAEGRYRLTGVFDGEVIVEVLSPSESPETSHWIQQRTVVEMGQPSQVDFDLSSSSAQIEGTVSLSGQPLANGLIKIKVTGSSGEVSLEEAIGSDGRYRAENLPGGSVTIQVTVQGQDGSQRSKTADLQISDGETLQQDFEFAATASVFGTISGIESGEAVTVSAVSGEHGGADSLSAEVLAGMDPYIIGVCEMDGAGGYRIERLEAGTYTIVAITHAKTIPEMRSAFRTMALEAGIEAQVDLTLK